MKFLSVFALAVMFFGCAPGNLLVFKTNSPEVYSYYSNGIPISWYSSDEEDIFYTAEEVKLNGRVYLRMWVLYKNNTDENILLEPFNLLSVDTYEDGELYSSYEPSSPSNILESAESEKMAMQIVQTIGGALSAISTQDGSYQFERQKQIISSTLADVENTESMHEIFQHSFNSGVLRVNTVFPGQSVNGYVYIMFNKISSSNDWENDKTRMKDLEIFLTLRTLKGNIKLPLQPVQIW